MGGLIPRPFGLPAGSVRGLVLLLIWGSTRAFFPAGHTHLSGYQSSLGAVSSSSSRGDGTLPAAIPNPVALAASSIEIVRFLGKIDVVQAFSGEKEFVPLADGSGMGRATSVRVFEARLAASALGLGPEALSVRCFLKEYLPAGEPFGRRELSTSRKLLDQWNRMQKPPSEMETEQGPPLTASFVPFPILLGSLRTDERIENPEFQTRWMQRFPRTKPPESGNLWLLFEWDAASFKTLKAFPALPQVVEGLDYFNRRERTRKRWAFVRRAMRRGLESIDFLHRTGYCHNAISTESIWLSTTNQLETEQLDVRITDLGASQRLSDLGPYARGGVWEDFYQLGLVFLELIVSSFSEDDFRVVDARLKYLQQQKLDGGGAEAAMEGSSWRGRLLKLGSVQGQGLRTGPLKQKEWATIFEGACDSDFAKLRAATKEISPDASELLELNSGEAWRLLFRMLARGRLVDEKGTPLAITGRGLLKEYSDLL